jgi:hypothetical protein
VPFARTTTAVSSLSGTVAGSLVPVLASGRWAANLDQSGSAAGLVMVEPVAVFPRPARALAPSPACLLLSPIHHVGRATRTASFAALQPPH